MTITLIQANSLHIPLPDESVHCCVTSPPYFGMRQYRGIDPTIWGGDPACQHLWSDTLPAHHPGQVPDAKWQSNPSLAAGQTAGSGQFCLKCSAWLGCLGLEPLPWLFIEHLVQVFREVRRVLRSNGVVFLNLGDSYAGSWGNSGRRPELDGTPSHQRDKTVEYWNRGGWDERRERPASSYKIPGLKPKDLIGIPWAVAFALRDDGWFLRSDILWVKGLSFCDSYSGSVMPESVSGWRWTKHRVKVENTRWDETLQGFASAGGHRNHSGNFEECPRVIWQDCPGCPQCSPNDGYILRKGSWRPTKSHEYLFMLAKTADYFCDKDAVAEDAVYAGDDRGSRTDSRRGTKCNSINSATGATRNLRTAWAINPQPQRTSHYAAFPEALVVPCIKAATSEGGVCSVCGAPYARVIDKHHDGEFNDAEAARQRDRCDGVISGGTESNSLGTTHHTRAVTLGFRPTCFCNAKSVPATVIDIFAGSGTTGIAARVLNRNAILLDLSHQYLHDNARERLSLTDLDSWQNGLQIEDKDLSDLPLFSHSEGIHSEGIHSEGIHSEGIHSEGD